jgi:autophagy-related protein 5
VHFSDWPDEELVRLDADGMVMHDAFINSVKEADFLRNGTAKGIMTLSKEDSAGLWQAVQDGNFTALSQSELHFNMLTISSGSPVLPTHLEYPPPPTEPTIPQRPNPLFPTPIPRLGLAFSQGRPISVATQYTSHNEYKSVNQFTK